MYSFLNWSTATLLASHAVTRSSWLMLPAGYLVLWSDIFSDLFSYEDRLSPYGFLEVQTRLLLVYFGAISAVIGLFLYQIFCPLICKYHREAEEYFDYVTQSANVTQLKKIIEGIEIDCGTWLKDTKASSVFDANKIHFYRGEHLYKNDIKKILIPSDDRRLYFSEILTTYYECVRNSHKSLCSLSIILMLLGVFLILVPSCEVFVLVLLRMFSI